MVQRYADGYTTFAERFTLAEVQARHPGMETEFGERFYAAMVAAEGLVGIGGGWREDPPAGAAGFAPPDFSFHEWQRWADGQRAWAAVDIIGSNARHTAAREWMKANGARFGLLTFWNVNGEPWHTQCNDHPKGVKSWITAGRPNPNPNFVIPGGPVPPYVPPAPKPINTPIEVGTMLLANPERRLIDTRTEGPKAPVGLLSCPTGLDPAVVRAVRVNITIVPQGVSGYCSINGKTSFCQFPAGAVVDHEKDFALQPDGTISLGATTPVHWIVDLCAEYH